MWACVGVCHGADDCRTSSISGSCPVGDEINEHEETKTSVLIFGEIRKQKPEDLHTEPVYRYFW